MKRTPLSILGALPYEMVREDCHRVKILDGEAISRQGARLADKVEDRGVIIPVPGHRGFSEHTAVLAGRIAHSALLQEKKVHVLDVLTVTPHPSLCEMKRTEGADLSSVHLKMHVGGVTKRKIRSLLKDGHKVYLLDNVVDTGMTVRAALEAVGVNIPVLAIGDTGRST